MKKLDFFALVSDLESQDKEWRKLAAKCADYYDFRQVSPERKQQLEACERLDFVGNLVLPAVNSVLGHEESSRRDWRVLADDVDSNEVAEALNQRLNDAMRVGSANRYCSDVYKDMLIKGVGWLFVDKNPDLFGNEYIFERVTTSELFWDMASTDPLLADCRWIARRKFMDIDEVRLRFPDDHELIDQVKGGWEYGHFEVGEVSTDALAGRYAEYSRAMQHYPSAVFDGGDSKRQRVAVYEVYYRVFEEVGAIRLPDGVVLEEGKVKRGVAWQLVRDAVLHGLAQHHKTITGKLRRKWFIGPHEVADEPSPHPHNHYPFVPFFAYREDASNTPYGIVRGMLDAQDKYNECEWEIQRIIDSLRVFFDPKALADDKMKASHLVHELNRKDGVIPVKDMNGIRVERDLVKLEQLHARKAEARDEVRMYSGIYSAYAGADSNAVSGVAINSLAALGATTLAEVNANYELGRSQVGALVLAHLVDAIQDAPTEVVVKDATSHKEKKRVALNQVREDGAANNLVVLARYKVALADAASSPGNQQQANRDFVEMFKVSGGDPALQAVLLKGVVKTSAVHGKAELLEEWEQAKQGGGNPEQMAAMQAQQMQMQQMQAQLEQAKAEAEVARQQAQAARDAAQARLYEAQAAAEIVKIEMLKAQQERGERLEKEQMIEAARAKLLGGVAA